jgi:hypothetical protein
LPQIPEKILAERLRFLEISSTNLLIAREAAIASGGDSSDWRTDATYVNILDYLCGGLTAPPSSGEGDTQAVPAQPAPGEAQGPDP